jgi:hypothetical protein
MVQLLDDIRGCRQVLHLNFVAVFLVDLIHSSNNFEWQITEHERIFG